MALMGPMIPVLALMGKMTPAGGHTIPLLACVTHTTIPDPLHSMPLYIPACNGGTSSTHGQLSNATFRIRASMWSPASSTSAHGAGFVFELPT